MDSLILYEKNQYGILTLNRPEKHNAISLSMAKQLKETLQKIKDDSIPYLVLTGAGMKSFCSGGDLKDFHGDLSTKELLTKLRFMKTVLLELLYFPVPTICLLQGDAFGGGCELATACDFRIAKEETSFGFVQSNIGILPGWGGGALLYEKVKPDFAFHWLVTGDVIGVDKLKQHGWIHEKIPNSQWGNRLFLNKYSKKSYQQMMSFKKQYLKSISIKELENHLDEELNHCANLWGSQKHKQYIHQFYTR